jgi:hypothetical protein
VDAPPKLSYTDLEIAVVTTVFDQRVHYLLLVVQQVFVFVEDDMKSGILMSIQLLKLSKELRDRRLQL